MEEDSDLNVERVTYNIVSMEDGTICEGQLVEMVAEFIEEPGESGHTNQEEERSLKRPREEDPNEIWHEVKSRKERIRESRIMTEITITAAEKFPKQFALAKLFKVHNINNIIKVRYVNPYKLIVEFNNEKSAEELIKCQKLLDLGWRFLRPMEVGLSYGVVSNIECGVSDQELLTSIVSPEADVVKVNRLKMRRDINEGNKEENSTGWIDSESVRIGFKGSKLPTYITIFEMKIKVQPYLFPVTQCSRCWRFGHKLKMCPSTRIYCAKCGGKHDNCETTTYKCINCAGDHISLSRRCPVYVREKKIRQLMADKNITYRKATSAMYETEPAPEYVPPPTPMSRPASTPIFTSSRYFDPSLPIDEEDSAAFTYANAAKHKHNESGLSTAAKPVAHKTPTTQKTERVRNSQSIQEECLVGDQSTESEQVGDCGENNRSRRKRDDHTFGNLLNKIKGIIFQSNETVKSKIETITRIYVQWAITWLFNNISSLNLSQHIFG